MPRGKNECYQGRGKEHLDNGNVSLIAAKYLGEWVGVVDSKALRGSLKIPTLAGSSSLPQLVIPYLQLDSCSPD